MAVGFILGRAGTGKTHRCLGEIRAALASQLTGPPRLILLVPEQAAFQMERALLADAPYRVLGRCEVLSFRRLARRIQATAVGPAPVVLSTDTRRMVLRDLLARDRSNYLELGAIATRPGVVQALADALVELLQEAAAPDRLAEAARLALDAGLPSAPRLNDLSRLYRAYLDFLGSERVDPEGVLDFARGRAPQVAWLDGARIWVDGFAGFTAQQERMLAALSVRAAAMWISLLDDPRASPLADSRVPPDPMALFARSQRTGVRLGAAFRAAGASFVSPMRLTQVRRFTAPDLALIERHLFEDSSAPRNAPPVTAANVRLVQAIDPRDEVWAAARAIRGLAADGWRYRDIAVIVRDLEPYHELVSAAFRELSIPYFIDRRRPMHHHPLVEFVRAALRLREPRVDARALPLLMKTGLLPLSMSACDALENYQLAHGLNARAGWHEGPWRYPPDGRDDDRPITPAVQRRLDFLNAARARLIAALGDWWPPPDDEARASARCRERVESLWRLIERCRVGDGVARWISRAEAAGDPGQAAEHSAVWSDLAGLLDDMVAALGDVPMTEREFMQVLEAGLAEFTLGLVPPTIDQVLVSAIERSRHPPIRAAFLLGFTEDAYPLRPGDDSLLGDEERDLLARAGVEVRPNRSTRVLDERSLVYVALTRASERLWISVPATDAGGTAKAPSPYLRDVQAALGSAAPEIESVPPSGLRDEVGEAATPQEFAERLGRRLRHEVERAPSDAAETADSPFAWYEWARRDAVLSPVLRRLFTALAPPRQPELGPLAAVLHPPPHRFSVSRLERFAACPFAHFARYDLGLRERARQEIATLQMGRFYHAMLDQFVNELMETRASLADLSDDDIASRLAAIADQAVAQFVGQSPMDPADSRRLKSRSRRELAAAIRAQRPHARTGLLPVGVERPFGTPDDDALPALLLRTPAGRAVELRGRIDRVDVLPSAGGSLAVVFDYKRSSGMHLRLDEVFHGLALQLLTYLLVLREHGDRLGRGVVRPAGAFYWPLVAGLRRVHHPDEAAEADPDLNYRPRGLIDFDALTVLDPRASAGESSRLYPARRLADGGLREIDKSGAAPRASFDALLDLVRARLGELCDDLIEGCIDVSPAARLRTALPCGHCPFGDVCRFEPASGFARWLNPLPRSEVLAAALGQSGPRSTLNEQASGETP